MPIASAKKLTSLLSRLGKEFSPEDPPARDPVTQTIVSFLTWNATRSKAEDAFAALMETLIDNNDVRVTYIDELVRLIGEDYPDAWQRMARLRESLHEVYLREHDIKMKSIEGKPKKDQRAYLDTLPGMTPYVAAEVTLLSFGGHAVPVDDKLLELLVAEGVFDQETTPAEAEGILLKQVKAADAFQTHLQLQAWSDTTNPPRKSPSKKKAPGRSAKTAKKPATRKSPVKRAKKK